MFAMRKHSRVLACVGIALAVIGGCEKDRAPISTPTTHGISRSHTIQNVRGSNRLRLAETQIVQLANEIPGFAGYYIDGASGQLVVYVKDSVQRFPRAAAALNAHLAKDGLRIPLRQRPRNVLIKLADYDFQTLSDYRDFITDSLLGAPGVVSDGIDHALNRVTVSVTDLNAQGHVLEHLTAHGIPAAAVHFKLVTQPTFLGARHPRSRALSGAPSELTAGALRSVFGARRRTGRALDDTLPAVLGAGFSFYDKKDNDDCTVGPVVDSAANRRYVSASHCTSHIFQMNGDTVMTAGYYYLGQEVADPWASGYSCGWDGCWHWRSSDAALFSIDTTRFVPHTQKGFIARPGTRSSVFGGARDTSIDQSHPWLYISDTLSAAYLVTGETIDHVGARSGWSYGPIINTCTDVYEGGIAPDANKIYCEVEADMGARDGDSGGPVFLYDGYDGATLIGIISAGGGHKSSYNYGTPISAPFDQWSSSYTSAWSAIENDLGTLDPLTGTTVSSPSIAGSISGWPNGVGVLTWAAVSTTNTTSSTQYQIFQWEWDASIPGWTQQGDYVGSTTSLTYTAIGDWPLYNASDTQADTCNYSSVGVEIRAYNQGAVTYSNVIWFQGPKNGAPGPAC